MDSLLESESRRLYSWWWDSHIPKNSKWLQENLADMDSKVKIMIKLIEADADSFARRAEMYYKKRPELMKLVEELYRAYRALAERYDHTTVELRHAHKTMVETFPNQIPFDLIEDSASSSSDKPQIQPSYDFKNLLEDDVTSKRGLSSDSCEVDTEIESLRRTLLELRTEKEALSLQFQLSLSKLSKLENELNGARNDARGFDERASKAEIEIRILKESLTTLEVERDAKVLEINQSMEKITDLEESISRGEEYAKSLTNRVSKAEIEARSLEEELSRLQSEKETDLIQYNQCLELISELEKKVKESEECVEMFRNQSEKSENEIEDLKQEVAKLNETNRDLSLRYQKCLEMISNLEREASKARENSKRLSSEVLAGAAKVKTMEEQCTVLESLNATLMVEADGLTVKMAVKDQELVEKQTELEKLQALIQDQHLQFTELEAILRNLETLHSQSQEEQKILDFELKQKIEMLKELEIKNHELEDSVNSFEEKNRNLSILKDSSAISLQIQENEIFSLKKIKEKLEEEVEKQMNKSNVLQEEIHRVKGEIDVMNNKYEEVMEQVRFAGLDPDSIVSSVTKLQTENSKLFDFTEKLSEMDKIQRRNTDLEKLLLESNTKLDGSREKSKDLQELCESLRTEKSELATERSNLFSQLQIMNLNMQKVLEKNSSLETSISGANIELECLREKSKYFEDFFQMLKQDKSELIKERESLVFQLFKVEERLTDFEKKFKKLETDYTDLQKMKNLEVAELQISLANEKENRIDHEKSTETRLIDLQRNVIVLQEECRVRKKEFEEELDRVVDKEVEIFILQKFIEDLEKKNFSLLIECQKHVEASKFSEKLISELENENLEQQMESELFLDEIDSLRDAIFQVVKTLELEADHKTADSKITKEQISVSRVLGEINNLKKSVTTSEYERQRLVIENSVLVSLLGEFKSDGLILETKKNILEKDLESIIQQCGMMKKDKEELSELNRFLKSEMIEREQREQELRAELQSKNLKLNTLHNSYLVLQQDYSVAVKENKTLVTKFSELKDEMCVVKEENDAVLREGIAMSNLAVVYRSFGDEMTEKVAGFDENLRSLSDINRELKQKAERLEEKLAGKDEESRDLNKKLEKLQEDVEEANWLNSLLEHQVFYVDEILETKAMEILEAKEMLEVRHNVNKELLEAIEELKKTCQESRIKKQDLEKKIVELTELNAKQEEEIGKLNAQNENLKTEIEFLNEEIEKQEVREQCLNLEFEIWEVEATSFYFDLQVSTVREVLLENKVYELTGICKNLEDESVVKSRKIKEMEDSVGFLESEVTELKTQLSGYDRVVASLAKDIKSLELSTRGLKRSSPAPVYQQREFDEHLEEESSQEPQEHGRNTKPRNGIKILQEMKTNLKTIEQTIAQEKDRFADQRTQSKIKDHKKVEETQVEDKFSGEFRPVKSRTELSTKDVHSNDQIVEIWEESNESESSIKFLINNTEPKKPLNSRLNRLSRNPSAESQVIDKLELSSTGIEDKKMILARLLSDSRRLASLRVSLNSLKTKLEINEKQNKPKNPDFVITRRQLKEMEEAMLQLVNTNEVLAKEIEETVDSRDIYNKIVAEKSRNGSEKIEEMQNKMEKIEKTVMKLENGVKGRGIFSESKTVILLRDIMHKSGKRTARKKKKNRFCGCIRASSAQEE